MLNARQGPIRLKEFREAGVEYGALRDMVREGTVLYPAMGIFAPIGEYDPFLLALSVLKVHGTDYFACLETAARFHGLLPHEDNLLWIVLHKNSDTIREVCGYEPVPVRWSAIRLPPERVLLSQEVKDTIGWLHGMSQQEATERYYGVYINHIHGAPIRITSPARTICDILRFQNKPMGREGLEGLHIPADTALDALWAYADQFDLDDAIEFSARLDYPDDVSTMLRTEKRRRERQPRMP